MSPKVTPKRMSSSSMLMKVSNPENINTVAMKGLTTRASHIPNYSDVWQTLLRSTLNFFSRRKDCKNILCI